MVTARAVIAAEGYNSPTGARHGTTSTHLVKRPRPIDVRPDRTARSAVLMN